MIQVTNELINKVCKFSDDLERKLFGNCDTTEEWESKRRENIYLAISGLKGVIVTALIKSDDFKKTEETIRKAFEDAQLEQEILDEIRLEARFKEAKVRADFKTALQEVERGTALSGILGYGFYNGDIMNLALIHKENEDLREKIEDLLEDCNFHEECADFGSGKYDKYIVE